MRRVILATNIAETSVTIPGIAFVVDGGVHKVCSMDSLPVFVTFQQGSLV